MHAWARWRSRSRSSSLLFPALLLACLSAGGACGQRDGEELRVRVESPVTRVGDRVLDQAVVDDLARHEDIGEAAARRRAVLTLQLAAAHEAAVAEGLAAPIDPARRRHLVRNAKARLFLEQVYTAEHGPDAVPDNVVARELASPRHFHPRLHFVCQVIVMAPQPPGGDPVLAPEDEQWRARARTELDDLARDMKRYLPDPGAETDCEYFMQLTRFMNGKPADDLFVRAEFAAMDVCRDDRWDPGFVSALCPREETGWIEPFWTQYGVHLVALVDVKPDNQIEESAREAALRDKLVPGWRRAHFGETMSRLRQEHTVRLHPELGVEAPAPAPGTTAPPP